MEGQIIWEIVVVSQLKDDGGLDYGDNKGCGENF